MKGEIMEENKKLTEAEEKTSVDSLIKTIFISILVFLGLLATIALAHIYYEANFDMYALSSFCSINDFIDCDGVARTTESQFFGVPLAY